MRNLLFIISFLLFIQLTAQEEPVKKNVAYFELAGSGLLYSFNYDRLLLIDQRMRLSTTIGFWYIPQVENIIDFEFMVGTSVGINTLIGKQTHFAEFGFNVAYMNMKDTEENYYHTIYLPIRFGYRYQKDTGGLFLRASFLPLVAVLQDTDTEFLYPVTPHLGIGVGYVF